MDSSFEIFNLKNKLNQDIDEILAKEEFSLIKGFTNTQIEFKNVKKQKTFKCPVCKRAKYVYLAALYTHVKEEHGDEIPDGMPVEQFVFNLKNKKTHGSCVICKKPTEWNPKINKYFRFCSEKCKEIYIQTAKERLIKVHGTDNLAKDPEHQKKMLENRSISKKYKFPDGKELVCVGSYEYDFIEHCVKALGFDSETIQECPFNFKYTFDNKERIYMPDYYIPAYNLIIEIKDKGNTHPNIMIKMKSMDKEKFRSLIELDKYNFIVVAGKDYVKFDEMIQHFRENEVEEQKETKLIVEIPKDVYGVIMKNSLEDYIDSNHYNIKRIGK